MDNSNLEMQIWKFGNAPEWWQNVAAYLPNVLASWREEGDDGGVVRWWVGGWVVAEWLMVFVQLMGVWNLEWQMTVATVNLHVEWKVSEHLKDKLMSIESVWKWFCICLFLLLLCMWHKMHWIHFRLLIITTEAFHFHQTGAGFQPRWGVPNSEKCRNTQRGS